MAQVIELEAGDLDQIRSDIDGDRLFQWIRHQRELEGGMVFPEIARVPQSRRRDLRLEVRVTVRTEAGAEI